MSIAHPDSRSVLDNNNTKEGKQTNMTQDKQDLNGGSILKIYPKYKTSNKGPPVLSTALIIGISWYVSAHDVRAHVIVLYCTVWCGT